MPKKKKTREQKVLADKRRNVENQSLYTFTAPLSQAPKKQPASTTFPAATISTAPYKYLASDLRKTIFFSGSIISAELVLKFFIK